MSIATDFLDQFRTACRTQAAFVLESCFPHTRSSYVSSALKVMVWYRDEYISVSGLIARLENEISYSSVYEHWYLGFVDATHRTLRQLSPLEGQALMVSAELDVLSYEEIEKDAVEALEEARSALYG